MKSTLDGQAPPYLGIDLTDRHSKGCRPIDVCGLQPVEDHKLKATFWLWIWDAGSMPLDIKAIARELKEARVAMIDGPQGLAASGRRMRDCEQRAGAPGHTPSARPERNRPFAGFIWSSLDLLAALHDANIAVSSADYQGVSEVYPGHIWQLLAASPLARKTRMDGRVARRKILESFGVVGLPETPTHDQNDACIAAVMAAAADGHIAGVRLTRIGDPLTCDCDGTLREGPMVIPELVAPRLRTASGHSSGG